MQSPLSGKRILLVVGGGIAAYKALDLVRRLSERGARVRGVLTKAGAEFITPLSLSALTGSRVYQDLFSLTDEAEMGHIELSRDADLVIVAPATADLLAKMAQGLANDLASTLLLATDKRVLVAPAMNVRMWLHKATQRNAATLRDDGILFVGPNDGEMACGEFGPGRMAEPLEIVAAAEDALRGETLIPLPNPVTTGTKRIAASLLAGRHVLVTAGPTHEPIDPVRFIANRSSGKQGYAIAEAAAAAGARVTLVSGPVTLLPPIGVTLIPVETAQEMMQAVEAALPADIAIFAAAVADWRVAEAGAQKIKKQAGAMPQFTLTENPDILATIARRTVDRPALVIGFAAETENVIDHARAKLARKGCDLIVANDVSPQTGVMGGDRNRVHLVSAAGVETWPDMAKDEVARALIGRIGALASGRAA
ncbi:MAG: bifunctional phosphopantothenoylcysteine decarboxylase/phosphopantothenate--cysteine ligase CoaBC [Labrys sp. (in: a-proteobacteria)]|jgi:phosphopantothenoylcysteine decarboxylase/phosphopantothenate--cysteine ligase